MYVRTIHYNFFALEEWISGITLRTCTNWGVVFDGAKCHLSACSGTRIDTLESSTSQIMRTVVITLAFSTTSRSTVWVSFEAFGANTSTCTVVFTTFCVGPTWRWSARTRSRCHFRCYKIGSHGS